MNVIILSELLVLGGVFVEILFQMLDPERQTGIVIRNVLSVLVV